MSKSVVKLTEEQEQFWNYLLMRVTNEDPSLGQPWAARAFFNMSPVYAPGLKTMSIDQKWIVYIDFDYMIPKGIIYAAGVLHHEVWHPLRNYYERARKLPQPPEGMSAAIVNNLAGDLESNNDILHLIPKDSIRAGVGSFKRYPVGLTHEQYFDLLIEDKSNVDQYQTPQQAGQGQSAPQEGDKSKSGQDSPGSGEPSENGSPSNGESSSGQGKSGKPQRGFPGGAPKKSEDKATSPSDKNDTDDSGDEAGKDGDSNGKKEFTVFGEKTIMGCSPAEDDSGNIDDFSLTEEEAAEAGIGLSEQEAELLKRLVAEDISAFPFSGVGSSASGARGWAQSVLKHKAVDWRQTLRAAVKNAIAYKRGKVDYTWTKLARRQPNPKLMRPGMHMPKVRVGIAIDKSGSNLEKLGLIIEEVQKIMKSVGVRGTDIQAFAVDIEADDAKPVNDPMQILKDINVGGGTRMTPGYNKLGSLDIDIALLFTDAEVYDWPKTKPETKNKGMKFYTVCVVAEGPGGDKLIQTAGKSLDSWGKIIDLRVQK